MCQVNTDLVFLSSDEMTKKEKLLRRFLSKPKDFTWEELIKLLLGLGFKQVKTGKTSGSRSRFINSSGVIISIHKPHPRNILKTYQIEQIITVLKQEKLL